MPTKGKVVQVTCKICHGNFDVLARILKRGRGIFCSVACYRISNRGKLLPHRKPSLVRNKTSVLARNKTSVLARIEGKLVEGTIQKHCPELGPCEVWTGAASKGRSIMRVADKLTSVARARWIATYGPLEENINVLHKCDNPLCARLSHLFTGTQLDNMRDKVAKGRQSRKLCK